MDLEVQVRDAAVRVPRVADEPERRRPPSRASPRSRAASTRSGGRSRTRSPRRRGATAASRRCRSSRPRTAFRPRRRGAASRSGATRSSPWCHLPGDVGAERAERVAEGGRAEDREHVAALRDSRAVTSGAARTTSGGAPGIERPGSRGAFADGRGRGDVTAGRAGRPGVARGAPSTFAGGGRRGGSLAPPRGRSPRRPRSPSPPGSPPCSAMRRIRRPVTALSAERGVVGGRAGRAQHVERPPVRERQLDVAARRHGLTEDDEPGDRGRADVARSRLQALPRRPPGRSTDSAVDLAPEARRRRAP